MSMTEKRSFIVGVCFLALVSGAVGWADDWPQWRGSNRDGVCRETGLLQQWPEGGPALLWELSGMGAGYSTVAILGGRLYSMGDRQVDGEKAQYVYANDLATRNQLWATKIGPAHQDGPRCTPTLDGGFVYAIGTEGDVVCLRLDDGKLVWSKNLLDDLGGAANPRWKFSESPLIDGDRLLCTPGGHSAAIAALDKATGALIWKTSMSDIGPNGRDEAGYSSIMISHGAGVKQYVQLTNEGLIGVAADSGKFLWGYNRIANRVANIPTPVIDGDYVFASTAYQTGSALLKLVSDGGGVKAEEVYWLDKDTFQNHHGGFVKVGDYIYGGHNHNKGEPTCLEMKTGKVMWHADQLGRGSGCVLYADGCLYFLYENGTAVLIEATPEKYNLKGSFKLPQRPTATGTAWPYPVISDGRLYLRHADVLFCYDVKAK
ncbi:MAG: PQQ-like beta-propeller repeat protein [Sedimentisphaerales bacterium]|jgi:outer membrane protein assembly factor BamB|nr:PQQ-like beta-propeller repeat protein [Sedimentisphaerales bacterium]HNY80347.1 PQQ-like beta-propeller repeat protein [Sedimentisphaerales bacterium]HOC64350.1 PQQ-like beta-propeller repeat protein [Sedimentisphaerales bacterium]HOH65994.1 PQQ-like beta-propeller repeat protein [Sedimentisphaerales bacterium]HPY50087.1 PQQ-like beta-propeller repeat protein [Sedimentisphaerales bacterium]